MRRLVVLVSVVLVQGCRPKEPSVTPPPVTVAPPLRSAAEVQRLIDDLAEVSESGLGFSPSVTGGQFLPVASSDESGMLLLGQAPPQRSTTLTRIVASGVAAVEPLIACLEDSRPTKLPPMKALMWMARGNEYDVNRRTTQVPAALATSAEGPVEQPTEVKVTVGDLCFVALGQIVGRNFNAVRYQPSGGLVVNSPPSSPALRQAVAQEWGGLTEARHRASLIADFEQPDHARRRVAATLRLGFYYPQALAPLLDATLARPTYDPIAIDEIKRAMYPASRQARERKLAALVRKHGEAGKHGLVLALFHDLDVQEAYEKGTISPPDSGKDYRARECLVELFGYPTTVKSSDEPYPEYLTTYDAEELLEAARHSGYAPPE